METLSSPPPAPSGCLAVLGDTFNCHDQGRWSCTAGRVCSGQGYCQSSCNAEDDPPQQRITSPQMSAVPRLRNPALDCVIRRRRETLCFHQTLPEMLPLCLDLGNWSVWQPGVFFTSVFNIRVEFVSSAIIMSVNRLSITWKRIGTYNFVLCQCVLPAQSFMVSKMSVLICERTWLPF